VPNGSGLFWRVEKDGVAPSWLFGTMHVPDEGVTKLRAPVAAAFAGASTLVVESTEVLATPDFASLQRHVAKGLLPAGETIDTDLSPAQKDALGRLTAAHGIPYFAARRMQPWFLAVALALPPCVKRRMLQGEPVLDQKLYREALAAGKEVIGLETMDEQFAAIASLDNDAQLAGLVEAAELGLASLDAAYATMIELYAEEKVALLPLLVRRMPEYGATSGSVEDMTASLLDARNHRMRDRLRPVLDRGGAFVAVGALHLSGTNGLVALLREDGYRVARVE